jgi:hypothetical protein
LSVKNIYDWHDWFAWRPIWDRWGETKVTMVIFETVQRRRRVDGDGEFWEYRPKDE